MRGGYTVKNLMPSTNLSTNTYSNSMSIGTWDGVGVRVNIANSISLGADVKLRGGLEDNISKSSIIRTVPMLENGTVLFNIPDPQFLYIWVEIGITSGSATFSIDTILREQG